MIDDTMDDFEVLRALAAHVIRRTAPWEQFGRPTDAQPSMQRPGTEVRNWGWPWKLPGTRDPTARFRSPCANPDTPLGWSIGAASRSFPAALKADQSEILSLRFVAGLTAREIAVVLDKIEASIHKRLHRTLRALEEAYDVGR